MDANMRTRATEIDPTNDFDSFYHELERRILTLISDDEDEDCVGSMIAKRATSVCVNRQRSILEQQTENYFCWKHDLDNHTSSVPVWLMNMWRNASSGTGVFIPRVIDTRRGYKPSTRFKGKGRMYKRLVD
ncbi:hypothetical protein L1987_12117 [Smallanthus sonchifolius]|uniref:Uncharacterized protein n=1 Tax=Smallanthus sonchifolius TaxID=185202 RepID=A0ACB9JF68_9ASTR|nr:hypothetical protein L1987_12117 [Smallanthus sonchifolius]